MDYVWRNDTMHFSDGLDKSSVAVIVAVDATGTVSVAPSRHLRGKHEIFKEGRYCQADTGNKFELASKPAGKRRSLLPRPLDQLTIAIEGFASEAHRACCCPRLLKRTSASARSSSAQT